MKKKIFYVGVVALAITLSSFSLTKKAASGNLYWFPLELGSGQPDPVSTLVYQAWDPALCTNWGLGDYCSAGFVSYGGSSGNYYGAGPEVVVDFHILF